MDNGKIRIEVREGVPIIDIYHHGEIGLDDIVWTTQTLLNDIEPPLSLPVDIIVNRSGSYSLSEDAYMSMKELMIKSYRIAYVIYNPIQDVVVTMAANTYLSDKKVRKFSSIEDALSWIQNDGSVADTTDIQPKVI